ncbi:MAG: N-acetyl-gamma-glutamyl-phosphate reductase [FCB group bacterium]|nr:N-acetyl-gamma-glutamyl-phosphate reductase [FCB group bacterium]
MKKYTAAIIGGSGYTGGELLRLLLPHPAIEVTAVTSRKRAGKALVKTHPNLRGRTNLKFIHPDKLQPVDILFLALPHGTVMDRIDDFRSKAKIIIDLSSDFRLKNPEDYVTYYGHEHTRPELLKEFVYGLPELHRDEIKNATLVAVPGCTATAAIIPIKPLVDNFPVNLIVIDSKVGSSAAGAGVNMSTHHPERSGVVRSFKPSGHRHLAEMQQELNAGGSISVNFSPHAIEMVRGIQSTIHVFLDCPYEEKDVWQAYLKAYRDEPFVRIVKERSGLYRFPEPKLLIGTNICEIGFEKDPYTDRLVVMAAIDNLMKGAAGQAVQCMNITLGLDELTGLDALGFHPI